MVAQMHSGYKSEVLVGQDSAPLPRWDRIVSGYDGAKRSSSLESRDSRKLPSSEDFVGQAGALEEGQIPNVGDAQDMPLVEIGTGAVGGGIV